MHALQVDRVLGHVFKGEPFETHNNTYIRTYSTTESFEYTFPTRNALLTACEKYLHRDRFGQLQTAIDHGLQAVLVKWHIYGAVYDYLMFYTHSSYDDRIQDIIWDDRYFQRLLQLVELREHVEKVFDKLYKNVRYVGEKRTELEQEIKLACAAYMYQDVVPIVAEYACDLYRFV